MLPTLWEHLRNYPLNFLSNCTAVHKVKFETWVSEVDVEEPYWPVESLDLNLLGNFQSRDCGEFLLV